LLYIGYTTAVGIAAGGLYLFVALHIYCGRVLITTDEAIVGIPAAEC